MLSHRVLSVDTFSKQYPTLNSVIYESCKPQPSRNGVTKELLNFKTEVLNPYNRCVGGYGRDVNVFFFLAEALWIYLGKRNVDFLSFFNSRMSTFSDDGRVFHAPYGFRLRHYGVNSEDYSYAGDSMIYKEDSNKHHFQTEHNPLDQIKMAVEMLSKNEEDRRVVLSVWNPEMDLARDSKDIPCNDMWMLKVREGKLHNTVQNRSNDLHWGLPTNIFQFSFLSEIIASCLGIRMGTQVHNSQSLHIYMDNPLPHLIYQNITAAEKKTYQCEDLYDYAESIPMKFNFQFDLPKLRIVEVDEHAKILMRLIEKKITGIYDENDFDVLSSLEKDAPYFSMIFKLLSIYIDYKYNMKGIKGEGMSNAHRVDSIRRINETFGENCKIDIVVLALNFFATRITDNNLLKDLIPNGSFIGKY
jgi:thymidylate synthase